MEKSYKIINSLNCMGKLVKKVVVELLSQFCKFHQKLCIKQIEAQKDKCVVDTLVIMINNIYKAYKKKIIVGILLINVKETFNYVFKLKLV